MRPTRLTAPFGYIPPPADPDAPLPYLSICSAYQNEAPYLREWIEFHRLVGVERFFLYDNCSTDNHRDVLAPYIDAGIVVLHDWPVYPSGQVPAFEHCLRAHMHDSRWIAFLDVDEFLFSPTHKKVSELLVDYQPWPGVAVNEIVFGTSGHRARPEGLVIENYTRRATRWGLNSSRKMIVWPMFTLGCAKNNPHLFLFREGYAVDEHVRHVNPYMPFCSCSVFRINHYWTKSEEEARTKFGRRRGDTGNPRPWQEFERRIEELNRVRDEEILYYLPALRTRMESPDVLHLHAA